MSCVPNDILYMIEWNSIHKVLTKKLKWIDN